MKTGEYPQREDRHPPVILPDIAEFGHMTGEDPMQPHQFFLEPFLPPGVALISPVRWKPGDAQDRALIDNVKERHFDMTKKLVSSVAAGALIASVAFTPMAFAQDATQPKPAEPQTMEIQPAPGAEAPADQAQTTPPATTEAPADMAQSGGTYITEQAADQIATSTYVGQTVYNAGDEKVGEINDLIIKKDGGVEAAVIGVGGFLGLGEKNVAVPFDRIQISEQANTDALKLTTTETAETLKAAPEFKTKAQQVAEQNANQPVDASTTSSTTGTAPATPLQPAPAEGTQQ